MNALSQVCIERRGFDHSQNGRAPSPHVTHLKSRNEGRMMSDEQERQKSSNKWPQAGKSQGLKRRKRAAPATNPRVIHHSISVIGRIG